MGVPDASSGARHPDIADAYADPASPAVGGIEVRYWASARAAAGMSAESVAVDGSLTLADLVTELTRRHLGSRLADVLHVCSVLRDGEQVGNRDPASVELRPGQSVEFLPPFAGG